MEAKFLASVISFLSIFLAIYADLPDFDYETAIYYGDSNVNIGEPFSITCIVPLADPIFWLKDGEPITRHNLRHGRDEHSYTLSESAIEDTDFLVPNYDNAEHQLKVFEIRSPLVLSCNITKGDGAVLKWEKNGTDVAKVKELTGRYRIIQAERKFIIDRTDIYDDGLYSCVVDDQKKDINVVARVLVRVPSNTGVVEGEKLSILCTTAGTDPQLSWKIGNLTISNSTGRYMLKPDDNHVKNAILSVENISLDDRGEYKCIGRNDANEYADYAEASDVSFVRVKGKLAALWPFLGICAEVLILCAIILIYEKRRNKSELEESDTDPQDHQQEVEQEEETETVVYSRASKKDDDASKNSNTKENNGN